MSHVRDIMSAEEEQGEDAPPAEDFEEPTPQLLPDPELGDEDDQFSNRSDFIRVTDDQ